MPTATLAELVTFRWKLLAGAVVTGLAVGAAVTIVEPQSFDATAKVFVSTSSTTDVTDLINGSTFTQQAVKSYAAVAITPLVLSSAARGIGVREPFDLLVRQVDVQPVLDTSVISITATASRPTTAAQLANAVAARLITTAAVLTPGTSLQSAPIEITQVQSAQDAVTQATPRPLLNVALAGAAGLILALVVLLLRERLNTRIRTAEDLEAFSDVPVLGEVTAFDNRAKQVQVAAGESAGRHAEEYRALRVGLEFLTPGETSRVILVTSATPGEGKTITAINLAATIAEAGEKVILVDADLRRSQVARVLGIDGSLGLSDMLARRASADVAVQQWGENRLAVLPAGATPPNPSELLQSGSMENLLDRLLRSWDYVILDSPPVLPVADGAILASRANATVMVCAARKLSKRNLQQALVKLDRAGVRPAAFILNQADRASTKLY